MILFTIYVHYTQHKLYMSAYLCIYLGPDAYQSEDIRLLDEEFRLGSEYLSKVAALRDECQELQWKRSAASTSRFSRPG